MSSREDFEAWFAGTDTPEMRKRALERNPNGAYRLMAAHSAWCTWQAAQSSAVRKCAELTRNGYTVIAPDGPIRAAFPEVFEGEAG